MLGVIPITWFFHEVIYIDVFSLYQEIPTRNHSNAQCPGSLVAGSSSNHHFSRGSGYVKLLGVQTVIATLRHPVVFGQRCPNVKPLGSTFRTVTDLTCNRWISAIILHTKKTITWFHTWLFSYASIHSFHKILKNMSLPYTLSLKFNSSRKIDAWSLPIHRVSWVLVNFQGRKTC